MPMGSVLCQKQTLKNSVQLNCGTNTRSTCLMTDRCLRMEWVAQSYMAMQDRK